MKLRRTLKNFSIVLIFIIAVWAMVAAQKQRIKSSAEKTLSDLLDAGIIFDHIRTNITSALTVENVRIIFQPETSQQIIVSIPRLHFAYQLSDFFKDNPPLRKIKADSVFIYLNKADSSAIGADAAENPSKKELRNDALPFPFRQLAVGYCRIDGEDSLKAELRVMTLDLDKDSLNRLAARVEMKEGRIVRQNFSSHLLEWKANSVLEKSTGSLSVEGVMAWDELSAGPAILGSGSLGGYWDGNAFELKDFASDFYQGGIRAKGVYYADASHPNLFDGSLENVRFDKFWASVGDSIAGSTGILNSRIHASGKGLKDTAWTIEAEHKFTELHYRSRNIADMQARMRVKRGQASFEIDHPDMHANALWGFGGKTLNGHFDLDMRSLDPLRLFVDLKNLRGNLRCNGDLSGTRDYPSLSVEIAGGGCRYENMAIDSLAGRLRFRNGILRMDGLSANHEPVPDLPVNLGKITVDGEMEVRNLTGKMEVRFVRPSIRGLTADSALAAFDLEDETFTLRPFRIFQSNHVLFESKLTAQAPLIRLGKQTPVSTAMALSRFKIGWLSPFIPETWQLGGAVSGELEIHGTAANPLPKGFLEIGDFGLNRGTRIGRLEGWRGRLSLENRGMRIDSLSGLMDSIPFRLTGDLETIKKQKVSGKMIIEAPNQSRVLLAGQVSRQSCAVESRIVKADLSILKKYLGNLSALSGSAEGEIAVLGPLRDPEIVGSVRLNKVTIQPAIMPSPLKNGSGLCRMEGHRFHVDSLRFDSENGRFSADATARLENRHLLLDALHVKTDQLTFRKKNSYNILVRSSTLALTPDGEQYTLNGQIDLGKTSIWQPFQIRDLISHAKRPARPTNAKKSNLDHIRCRIRFQTNEKCWIDNNLAKLRLSPEIEITGTLAKPNLKGRVTVKEGYALYLDRKFQIKQGTLDFIDPYQINPVVELSAETTIRDYETSDKTAYTITLSASGPVNEAQIRLASDPEMSQPEIITLLTLGTTRKQLANQGGISRDKEWVQVIRQRAEALSSQRINAYATQRIGTLLKLDHLSIDGNLFQNGKSTNPQITASRALTPKINVKYMNRVGQLNDQFIVVDYQFSRRLLLEGQTNQYGQSGMDLKYRIGFK